VEATLRLARASTIPVIASGGVSRMEDIVGLCKVASTNTGAGIMGAITGRAIYEGALDLAKAQDYCDSFLKSGGA